MIGQIHGWMDANTNANTNINTDTEQILRTDCMKSILSREHKEFIHIFLQMWINLWISCGTNCEGMCIKREIIHRLRG